MDTADISYLLPSQIVIEVRSSRPLAIDDILAHGTPPMLYKITELGSPPPGDPNAHRQLGYATSIAGATFLVMRTAPTTSPS